MAIFNNLSKAAKGFFLEEAAPAASPSAPQPAGVAPLVTQAEPRHLDHIAGLLASNGKDFGAFTKLVGSRAGSGLTGPLLYQTAFNAFAALTGTALPAAHLGRNPAPEAGR
jgi:hypothetical protein